MNSSRRHLLQSITAIVGASGVDAQAHVVDVPPESLPALIVLQAPGPISPQTADRLEKFWTDGVQDTPFKNVRVCVLADGLTMTVLDANGRVLNRPVAP